LTASRPSGPPAKRAGLIEDQQDLLGRLLDQTGQVFGAQHATGGIVWRCREEDAGLRREVSQQALDIVAAVGAEGNLVNSRASAAGGDGVAAEGGVGHERPVAGPQEDVRHGLQQVVAAVAANDPRHPDPQALRQPVDKGTPFRIGIAVDLPGRLADRLDGLGRRRIGAFVEVHAPNRSGKTRRAQILRLRRPVKDGQGLDTGRASTSSLINLFSGIGRLPFAV
jgi:hypothetical protein